MTSSAFSIPQVLQWAQSFALPADQKFELNHCAVQSLPGFGNCVVASEDIQSGADGTIVLVVPRAMFMSSTNSPIASSLPKDGDEWERLALTLIHELTLEGKSAWADYLRGLPKPEELNMPLFWTEPELEPLQGLSGLLDSPCSAVQVGKVFAKSVLAFTKKHRALFADAHSSWPAYRWVNGLIMSRAFEEKAGHPFLVPILDYINTHPTAVNCAVHFEPRGAVIRTLPNVKIAKGQQLFISYGYELSNAQFLIRYGFVPESNPHNGVDVLASTVSLICMDMFEGNEDDSFAENLHFESFKLKDDGKLPQLLKDFLCAHMQLLTQEEFLAREAAIRAGATLNADDGKGAGDGKSAPKERDHTEVWGSFFKDGKWGYKCCQQTEKSAKCSPPAAAAKLKPLKLSSDDEAAIATAAYVALGQRLAEFGKNDSKSDAKTLAELKESKKQMDARAKVIAAEKQILERTIAQLRGTAGSMLSSMGLGGPGESKGAGAGAAFGFGGEGDDDEDIIDDMDNEEDNAGVGDFGDEDAVMAQIAAATAVSGGGKPWECVKCTFRNTRSQRICELCGHRPSEPGAGRGGKSESKASGSGSGSSSKAAADAESGLDLTVSGKALGKPQQQQPKDESKGDAGRKRKPDADAEKGGPSKKAKP